MVPLRWRLWWMLTAFTYASTGADETFTVDSDSKLTSAFTLVRGGAYSQPEVFQVTGSNVTAADGLVTLTVTGNTTIKRGGSFCGVSIDLRTTGLGQIGKRFTAVSASSTTITFYASVPDSCWDRVGHARFRATSFCRWRFFPHARASVRNLPSEATYLPIPLHRDGVRPRHRPTPTGMFAMRL